MSKYIARDWSKFHLLSYPHTQRWVRPYQRMRGNMTTKFGKELVNQITPHLNKRLADLKVRVRASEVSEEDAYQQMVTTFMELYSDGCIYAFVPSRSRRKKRSKSDHVKRKAQIIEEHAGSPLPETEAWLEDQGISCAKPMLLSKLFGKKEYVARHMDRVFTDKQLDEHLALYIKRQREIVAKWKT